jgi:TolB-like protein/Flp pilus assembly protein TadD
MAENPKTRPITIDLSQFKLHIDLKKKIELTLHFNSPSRRFYLSVIALVVNEMKRQGKLTSIPLEEHCDLLALLNDTVGGSAGSSDKENLLPRIYRKWQHALPNLEEAPLFKVLGRRKEYDEGTGKTYPFTEAEKDSWANLFEYKGSEENVRLKFAIDKIGAGLDDVDIVYEDSSNGDAWERFLSSLKGKVEKAPEIDAMQAPSVAPEAPVSLPGEQRSTRQSRLRRVAFAAVIGVILGAGTLTFWILHLKPAPVKRASIEKMAFPLPDVPSIAVLPFVNLSEDPKQEFLSDGITEDIITALSKVHNLFVIARNSTFAYKGKPVKIKQVSEELGVQYVLEGSVERSGDRIRINAQLIDALTGHHVWSERYERELKDIFALQDEITLNILTATRVKLTEGQRISGSEKYFRGKQGFDCYLKMLEEHKYREGFNNEDNRVALRIAKEMVAMCPENPIAYLDLASIYYMAYWLDTGQSRREFVEKGIEMNKKALAMDDSIPIAYSVLSSFYLLKREYDKAIAEAERALALAPDDPLVNHYFAGTLVSVGRAEEAIPLLQKAIRLDPVGWTGLYLNFGHALRMTGRFEEAISAYKKSLQRAPNNIIAHVNMAVTYIMMGREEEAHAEAAEVLRLNPNFSADAYARSLTYKDQSEIDKYLSALRKTGLR